MPPTVANISASPSDGDGDGDGYGIVDAAMSNLGKLLILLFIVLFCTSGLIWSARKDRSADAERRADPVIVTNNVLLHEVQSKRSIFLPELGKQLDGELYNESTTDKAMEKQQKKAAMAQKKALAAQKKAEYVSVQAKENPVAAVDYDTVEAAEAAAEAGADSSDEEDMYAVPTLGTKSGRTSGGLSGLDADEQLTNDAAAAAAAAASPPAVVAEVATVAEEQPLYINDNSTAVVNTFGNKDEMTGSDVAAANTTAPPRAVAEVATVAEEQPLYINETAAAAPAPKISLKRQPSRREKALEVLRNVVVVIYKDAGGDMGVTLKSPSGGAGTYVVATKPGSVTANALAAAQLSIDSGLKIESINGLDVSNKHDEAVLLALEVSPTPVTVAFEKDPDGYRDMRAAAAAAALAAFVPQPVLTLPEDEEQPLYTNDDADTTPPAQDDTNDEDNTDDEGGGDASVLSGPQASDATRRPPAEEEQPLYANDDADTTPPAQDDTNDEDNTDDEGGGDASVLSGPQASDATRRPPAEEEQPMYVNDDADTALPAQDDIDDEDNTDDEGG